MHHQKQRFLKFTNEHFKIYLTEKLEVNEELDYNNFASILEKE